MGTAEIKLELKNIIEALPVKKLGRAKDILNALLNDNIIKDDLSDSDLKEIKKGIKDTEKGNLYSVAEVMSAYRAKKKTKKK